jgi:simple sugar transport system ATP-binding protein
MPEPIHPTPHPTATDADDRVVIRMENITKRFPGVVANQGVGLQVRAGSFHAVIGENGAGKSTLLNILYGRYRPDAGRLFLRDEEVTRALHSPADAIRRGLGLVSQHYALIPALSVLENVILGAEPTRPGGALNLRQAADRIRALAERLGVSGLDLSARAERLSVAAQQKVEILKALYRGADILLLDEPTATLAPQEADALFALLRALVADGATVVFVTHKLREVMTHSDAVTVLRAGRNVGNFQTSQTNEQELLLRMIGSAGAGRWELGREESESGHRFLVSAEPIAHRESRIENPLLQIEGVTVRGARGVEAAQDIRFEVGPGEIVGVAGVDGSGQRELSEAIVGLRPLTQGRLFLAGREITRLSVRERQRAGLVYIPEDRHRVGLILDFTVAENYLLGHEWSPEWGGGLLLRPALLLAQAEAMIRRYDVRAGQRGPQNLARALSGGNQQKIVFARAMDSVPRLLIACQPTRGLDVEASRFVYKTLRQAREAGLSILLFSLDLDEIFALSDRIAVLFNGRLAGVLPCAQATPELVGHLMTTGSSEAGGHAP